MRELFQEEILAHENIVNRLLQDLRTGKILIKSWKYLSLLLRPVPNLTLSLDLRHNIIKFFLMLTLKLDNLSFSLLGQISLLSA